MNKYNQEGKKKALAILTIIIIVVFIGHLVSTLSFNGKVHTVKGADDSKTSYMSFSDREDSTSSWLKRDYDLYGKTVDLSANTLEGTLFNRSSDRIVSWKMIMRIKGDCFISNAWCGTMEIHQHAGTDQEVVQRLDLRNYQLEEIKLEYLYDGDLLIPLHEGDYLVYYPSKKDDEIPIDSDSELTIGTIFYYLDSIDLSDYEIRYSYRRDLMEGIGFYALLGLILLWLGLLISIIVARFTYHKAVNEMEIRMSGLSYMSDIYDIIYIIDIETDELTPITADEDSEKNRPEYMGARDQILNLFAKDAAAPYVELMQEFGDIRTLNERLGKQSIACDYYSKSHGWTRIRFLAMDREPGQPLKRVLFTIRNIEEEKQFSEESEQRILKSGTETRSKSIFFDIMSDRVRTSVQSMLDDAAKITEETHDRSVTDLAEHIDNTGTLLLTLAHRLVDASDIYAGTVVLNPAEYSFKEMIAGVYEEMKPEADRKGLAFETDISPNIPDGLYGDSVRIRKVILFLLENSIRHAAEGSVRLAVFGKQSEDQAHLLISIKDTGDGIREKDLKRLTSQWAEPDHSWNFTREEPGLGLTMIHELLRLMGSGLGVISEYGNGSEFYFEIDQKVVDPTPIGAVELS